MEISKNGYKVQTSKCEENLMLYHLNRLKDQFGFSYKRNILEIHDNKYALVNYYIYDAAGVYVTSVINSSEASRLVEGIFHISNWYREITIPGIDNHLINKSA